MGAVGYRFRAELRLRWRAWVGLAAIVGIIAGTVILLAAGSRRTSSAYDRFLSEQNAYDAGLLVQCKPVPGGPGAFAALENTPSVTPVDQSCIDEVAALPAVAEATRIREYPGSLATDRGVSLQPSDDPCFSGPGQVSIIADPSGRFGTTFNKSRIVAGRVANPAVTDEVVISKDAADRMHLGPGDRLRMRLFEGADCQNSSAWGNARTLKIVGVGLAPGEIAPPSGFYLATVNLTPAFARDAGTVAGTNAYLMTRVRDGATVKDLERQATRAGYAILPIISAREQSNLLRDSTRPVAYSLALIAALVALAGIVVLGQVLVRQVFLESGDRVTLAALGLTPSRQLTLALFRAGFVGSIGAVVAVGIAVVGSSLMPTGVARDVEPAPGINVDLAAIALGFVVTVLFVLVVSAVPAWRIAVRAISARPGAVSRRRGSVPTAMARHGVGPVPVSGVRLALDRGSGTRTVPVWSSIVGLMIAMTTLIGALTFGAALTYLLDTPRIVGWNWDVMVGANPEDQAASTSVSVNEVNRQVRGSNAVAASAAGTFYPPFPNGRRLELGPNRIEADMTAFDATGSVGPSVIEGHQPRGPDELLLGPDTLTTLNLRIGDMVTAVGQAGTWEKPGKETSARMRIVGTGVLPGTDLGRGASMTLDGLGRLNDTATQDGIYVRRAAGVTNRELRADLERVIGYAPALFTRQVVDPSGKLTDLRESDDVPSILGALMALMAAAVLAHLLVSAVGQHRRDLALLRTLGFTRGQVTRAVGWQVSTYTLVTLAVSVPLGIALGRTIWRSYAESIGVVPEPVSPWAGLAAIGVAAFVIANLIAVIPARRATRAAPAAILRTE